ncbi:hypothetical protein ACIRU8_02975 [Streptomyces sp. NPDC101175]|uniref:hypothetical protein n=1 Tax=Streptomyces sp. NPDC101175 TaxID=3366123 RepID=UPI0038338361
MHIVTALGLVRARQMITDEDHFQVTAETIAIGMIGIHRKRRGSVIFVSRSDRSDRVDLWIGFHDQLAEAARQIDAEDARRTAQEAADKAKRKAERARDARMTGAMTEHIQTPTGEPLHATVADLRFHDRVPPAHTAVPEPGSPPAQRARELIAMGVRDTSALARVLESEGVRVPSSSYLRRLVREGRS